MPRSQKGFTLIEIIVVLVIIGILAVFAIPRYMDLTADARNKAAYAALAEGMARVNQVAAKGILQNNGTIPSAASVAATLSTGTMTDAGDFSLAYSGAGTGTAAIVTITAAGISGNVSGGSITGTVRLPFTE